MEENKISSNEQAEQSITDNQQTESTSNGTESTDTAVEETAKLKAELEEQKDKYLRLFAEFDNYKRRSSKERIELIQTAGREVITSLLDVLDDSDRAEKQLNQSDDIKQIKEGVLLVFGKIRTALQSKGLKSFSSIGEEFDVEKHEAITSVPVQAEKQKGKVVDEVQKGYYLNDKLIRFAKVVVGS